MKPLDDELRNLLRRKDPPEGLAERVMARLERQPARLTFGRRVSAFFRPPVLRWAAVAAVVVRCGRARASFDTSTSSECARRPSRQASRPSSLCASPMKKSALHCGALSGSHCGRWKFRRIQNQKWSKR